MFEVRKLYDNRYIIGIEGETEDSIRSLTPAKRCNRKKRLKSIFGKTVFANAIDAHIALARIEAYRYIHSLLMEKSFLEAANTISTIARVPCVKIKK